MQKQDKVTKSDYEQSSNTSKEMRTLNTKIYMKDNRPIAFQQKQLLDNILETSDKPLQLRTIRTGKMRGGEYHKIKEFCDKTYQCIYKGTGYAHFNLEYKPRNRLAKITLPVFFDPAFATLAHEAPIFINTVENSWSNKFKFRCKADGCHQGLFSKRDTSSINGWKTALNDVMVKVKVKNTATKGNAYFTAKYESNRQNGVNKTELRITNKGIADTLSYNTTIATAGCTANTFCKKNSYAHEAGHMFGLDDEYQPAGIAQGTKAEHYDLVKDAFGDAEADSKATQDNSRHSLMGRRFKVGENQVEKHDYVTFWDAFIKALEAGSQSEKSPNKKEDWDII